MVTVSSIFLTFRSSGNLLQMHQPVATSKGKRKERERERKEKYYVHRQEEEEEKEV